MKIKRVFAQDGRYYYIQDLPERRPSGRPKQRWIPLSRVDEGEAAEHGEWRRRWTATVQTDLVQDLALPLQQTITLRPTVGADIDVIDPDTDLT